MKSNMYMNIILVMEAKIIVYVYCTKKTVIFQESPCIIEVPFFRSGQTLHYRFS